MSNIEYKYGVQAATATYTFTWEINKFIDVLQNGNISEYRMKKSSVDTRPQLKMELLGRDHDIIEIYYLFPTQVHIIKAFLKVGATEITVGSEESEIDANKWHYLAKLHKTNILNRRDNYFKNIGNNVYSEDIVLNIKFQIRLNDTIPENSNQLRSNLENVLNTGLFSDVIIKSNEGKEYKVHKVILGCRSAVLKAHFEHDTTECHTNIVEAPFETDVLEEVLSYIYSEKVSRIEEIPGKILAAADYYQLNELKSLCGREMCKQLSVKNVLNTLEMAELYHENSLKQSALEFIKHGNAGLIMHTEAWNDNISVQLVKCIYEHINSKTDTKIVYCDGNYNDDEPQNKKSKSCNSSNFGGLSIFGI